jgi:hypothetical protein
MEQADALRQEKIINDFIKKHPHLLKASKPKKRDILSEAEYNHSDGIRLHIESTETES